LSSLLPLRWVRRFAAFPLLFLANCAAGGAGAVNIDDLAIAGNVPVCDGQTLSQLEGAKTISDNCKLEVQSYLPAPSNDFSGRVMVLGQEERDDGSLRVYVAGTDQSGRPLSAAAFGTARVAVQTDGGGLVDSGAAVTVTPFGKLSEDVLSLEIVNDYSASMSLGDLETVAGIEHDLIAALPPIYEGEVTLFSSQVRVKQSFTSDRAALLDAVECDENFDRELTALYDGMGNGLDSLTSRARPARVLVVSTDGRENASVAYKKSDLVNTITNDGVVVIMLGALFADVNELKSLAGPRGAYFYTPLYADMQSEVNDLSSALANGAALDIPADVAQMRPLSIELLGESVDIE
jgi:hypothetical protein